MTSSTRSPTESDDSDSWNPVPFWCARCSEWVMCVASLMLFAHLQRNLKRSSIRRRRTILQTSALPPDPSIECCCPRRLRLMSLSVQSFVLSNRHSQMDRSVRRLAGVVCAAAWTANAFNLTTAWLFVTLASHSGGSSLGLSGSLGRRRWCRVKQWINFVLTAVYKTSLYLFFIQRVQLAVKNTVWEFRPVIIALLRATMILYGLLYVSVLVLAAHVDVFDSFHGGFDCFWQTSDAVLWLIGLVDSSLAVLCCALFVRKLRQVSRVMIQHHCSEVAKLSVSVPSVSDTDRSSLVLLSHADINPSGNHIAESRSFSGNRRKSSKETGLGSNARGLSKIAHKVMVLSSVAILSTWLFTYIGYSSLFSPLGWFVPIDTLMNLLCVWLTFACNERYFDFLCGWTLKCSTF